VDNLRFTDGPVVVSQISSSDAKYMPLRQSGHLEYNLLQRERIFLTDDNTCVIDSCVGLYGKAGKELKLNKDKINTIIHSSQDSVKIFINFITVLIMQLHLRLIVAVTVVFLAQMKLGTNNL
jgi:hypothetical protein